MPLHLLLNADVFAPEPLGRKHLLVGGRTILWIGDEVPALDHSLGVEETDLAGRRVIPGLIDGHAHLTGGGGEAGYAHPGSAGRAEPVHAPAESPRWSGCWAPTTVARTPGELVATANGLVRRGDLRLVPHRRLPPAAGDRHRQCARRHRAHRPDHRRRRNRAQRSSLQPADARRAAADRRRGPCRRTHDRQGRHRASASGRRTARSRPGAARRSTRASSRRGSSTRPT